MPHQGFNMKLTLITLIGNTHLKKSLTNIKQHKGSYNAQTKMFAYMLLSNVAIIIIIACLIHDQ